MRPYLHAMSPIDPPTNKSTATVDSLPHTGTGKIQKAELRKQYKDYELKAVSAA